MDGPTLDEVRNARTEIIRQFRDIAEFAGAGIGESNGKFSVRVNWRVLPKNLPLPSSIGGVADHPSRGRQHHAAVAAAVMRGREANAARGGFGFECQTAILVIAGRREAAGPESITTIGSMDSGLAPRGALRNDDGVEGAPPHSRGAISRPGLAIRCPSSERGRRECRALAHPQPRGQKGVDGPQA